MMTPASLQAGPVYPPVSGNKRQYPNESMKEYGEGLRILESDNRKRLENQYNSTYTQQGRKNEPAPQFAEFSNMLGQLQQQPPQPSANKNSPLGTSNSPSVKSPLNKRTSVSGTTPLSNGLNSNVQNGGNLLSVSIAQSTSNKKKQARKKTSSSVPVTPATPNAPPTPQNAKASTPTAQGTTISRRGRKKTQGSTASTPHIKEELTSVTEGVTTDLNDVDNGKNHNDTKLGKKHGNVKKEDHSQPSQPQRPNDPSNPGFDDPQLLGDFNNSEQFFDFGLYTGEEGSEMLQDFFQ